MDKLFKLLHKFWVEHIEPYKDFFKYIKDAIEYITCIASGISAIFSRISDWIGWFPAMLIGIGIAVLIIFIIKCCFFAVNYIGCTLSNIKTINAIEKEQMLSKNRITEKQEEALIEINKTQQIDKNKNELVIQNNLTELFHQRADDLITDDVFKKKVELLSNQISEPNKLKFMNIMPCYCEKKQDYTQEDCSKFEELFRAYFGKILTETKKKLLEKLMNKVHEISTRAMMFLIHLDEKDINILKQQFRYVTMVNNFGYIAECSDIRDIFDTSGLNAIGFADKLKFFNDIWQIDAIGRTTSHKLESWHIKDDIFCLKNQITGNGVSLTLEQIKEIDIDTLKLVLQNIQRIIFRIGIRPLIVTKQPNYLEKEIKMDIFAQLTEVGVEIYGLLKDEIEEMPQDYIQKVLECNQQKYPELGFILN